uniref:DUF2764 family protein n=1 Tax=Steinernema glaseri TaxID=37863 RepID=A0A1I8AIE9_9BILA
MFLFTLLCGYIIPLVYFLYSFLTTRRESSAPIEVAPEQIYEVLRSFVLTPETLEIFKNATEEELLKIKAEISVLPSWVDLGLLMEIATDLLHFVSELCEEDDRQYLANQWLQAFIFTRERLPDYFEEKDQQYDLFIACAKEFREAVLDDIAEIATDLRTYVKGINPYREFGILYFARFYVQFGVPRGMNTLMYRKRIYKMLNVIMESELKYEESMEE